MLLKSDLKYIIANFPKMMESSKKGSEEVDLCCWLRTRTDKIGSFSWQNAVQILALLAQLVQLVTRMT